MWGYGRKISFATALLKRHRATPGASLASVSRFKSRPAAIHGRRGEAACIHKTARAFDFEGAARSQASPLGQPVSLDLARLFAPHWTVTRALEVTVDGVTPLKERERTRLQLQGAGFQSTARGPRGKRRTGGTRADSLFRFLVLVLVLVSF